MLRRFLITAIAIALGGCATPPVSYETIDLSKIDRIVDLRYRTFNKGAGFGKIALKFENEFKHCKLESARVYVNAIEIANIQSSDTVLIFIPITKYTLSVHPKDNCGALTATADVTIKRGTSLNYRVGYNNSGTFSIEEASL